VIRGILALFCFALMFLIGDIIQRTLVVLIIRIAPSRRERVLTGWMDFLKRLVMGIVRRVGGARIDNIAPIEARPGILIVMNHQSLLDIPTAFEFVAGDNPLFVTRQRYSRGIPLLSHMLRLYGHPFVEPTRNIRPQLEKLAEHGRTSEHPIVIFPEGSRTRDRSIRPFRTAGLKALLPVRRWEVYVVVVDGLWRCAKFDDFVRNISSVRAKVADVGPLIFDSQDAGEADEFITQMREHMCDTLAAIRAQPSDGGESVSAAPDAQGTAHEKKS
jgi:1-acyl-sn-glycerol-3-phosphate acyltransferase